MRLSGGGTLLCLFPDVSDVTLLGVGGGSVLCYTDTRTVKSVTFAHLNYKALCSLIFM